MEDCTYIGIDLAWSPRNPSGIVALRGNRQTAELSAGPTLLGSEAQIAAFIAEQSQTATVIVAVDAPLRVANERGRRPAEAALAAAFARYEAAPHPANRRLLARAGVVRGEALVAALGPLGFAEAPMIEAGQSGRIVVEVYPHPAMIAIFGLARTLKYKAKAGRSRELVAAEFARYQALVASLASAEPSLLGLGAQTSLLSPVSPAAPPSKPHEDQLDALFCAYIALYGHYWGRARCASFGDAASGAIFTPVPAHS